VFVNDRGVWSLWVRDADSAQVRVSLDEFTALGIHEYQRVRLKLPLEEEQPVFFRGKRENPPFVWLDFGADVRRR
jgi:hypothetical protein